MNINQKTLIEKFENRHIGPSQQDVDNILNFLGYKDIDEFIKKVIPSDILRKSKMDLPQPLSEAELAKVLKDYSLLNKEQISMIGMGYYNTFTPPVILRNILENPAWYTAYTPYQPEISQGRLEALLNFQTMVSDLTALPIANASLLDESTAAAEAMTMCLRAVPNRNKVLIDTQLHPQTKNVLITRAKPLEIHIEESSITNEDLSEEFACLIIQYPGSDGQIHNWKEIIKSFQEKGGLVIMITDLLSLTVLSPPGELGADVAVGSAQRFGVPMGFGGPHAAFFATKDKFSRKMPGRLIGVSIDSHGEKAYRLALQTREQHIRREKATSNICTAQALLAIISGFYGIWHGPEGLKNIAENVHNHSKRFALSAIQGGFKLRNKNFFDTIVIETGKQTSDIYNEALSYGYNLRKFENSIGISFDETSNEETLKGLASIFGIDLISIPLIRKENFIPNDLKRQSAILTHPIFSSFKSETDMLRYIRRLSDKDLALDRTMIPLGSCTMKLNATSEMLPITKSEFCNIHPFAPKEQTQGYVKLINELEEWLCILTGYDGISLQPNAGSQGEYAGLLSIRNWHLSNGDHQRNVCLIPTSAHGTNPASAIMTGMQVVLIECDEAGNIDINDLEKKASEFQENLAAIMITYPSTHGVFEKDIKKVCEIVHQYGGQVYVDGANLNALIGLVSLPEIGADVSHLNLHKTFCIPHGGGGPGVGPVAVKKHLIPFLPGDPISGQNPVSSSNFGSAGILPISWSYIIMMGEEGLRNATKIAILSANYIAEKLKAYYPVLYTGENGLVAHECILDINPIQQKTGITNEDIAKRLIDYGFHAPTMSWPVPNTLMVEPTESEPLKELDRFCDAMISISKEISKIKDGSWPKDDNPLVNSPHTINILSKDNWTHPYNRKTAIAVSKQINKYWSPVGRIDNAFGDRNLVCSCPPMDSYK